MSIRLDGSSEPARLPPFDAPGEPCPKPSLKPLIERRKGIGPAQLSFAQERLWFLDQIAPGDVLFNLSQGTRIIGSLDLTALQKALAMVVARHEILRTTFAKSEHHANTDGRQCSQDRKSTRLNSSHRCISYAVFCLKKKKLNSSH